VHPKTRNNATTSARRAVGSLDVLRSYRNPCFKHVSWTSLYRFQRSEIREKKSVTLEIQNCLKKRERENLLIITEKLKNARQRDRFSGRFIPAFREIQDHLILKCVYSNVFARAKRGRTKKLYVVNKVLCFCVSYFLLQNPKRTILLLLKTPHY
jgi:hypothetical protein